MGHRLLLVEDEQALSRAMTRLLRRHGYDISLANSAATAREASGPFALGIFDIDLPDGDGVALASELLEKGVVERAVFFSGTRDGDQQRRAETIATLVDKGDGFPQLIATIARAIENQQARVAGGDASFEHVGGPPPSGVRNNGDNLPDEDDEDTD
jgi:DNA-binding response OmpR family regulator